MTNEDGLDKCAANYVPLTPLSPALAVRTLNAPLELTLP